MPYIFISAVALCANLYRCAPLIVGDKYADPELMEFLGAKITTDYPEPNSPPMYVMFATMRSVLDALQEIGYELNSSHMVQGYTTLIMSKPAQGDSKELGSVSEGTIRGNSEIETEPEAKASRPRRSKQRTKEKSVEAVPQVLSAAESEELRDSSSKAIKAAHDRYVLGDTSKREVSSRENSHKRLPRTESEYAREDRQRRPVSNVNESTSTRDLPSISSNKLLGLASDGATSREHSRKQRSRTEENKSGKEPSFQRMPKTGSDASRPESSFTKRQGMKRDDPSKDEDLQPKDLEPRDSTISEKQEPEPRMAASESETPSHSRKLKGRGSSDTMSPHEKNSKHKGTKGVRRKSSSMNTPVKNNFKN